MATATRAAAAGDEASIANVQTRGWRVAYRGQLPDALLDALDVHARAASKGAYAAD